MILGGIHSRASAYTPFSFIIYFGTDFSKLYTSNPKTKTQSNPFQSTKTNNNDTNIVEEKLKNLETITNPKPIQNLKYPYKKIPLNQTKHKTKPNESDTFCIQTQPNPIEAQVSSGQREIEETFPPSQEEKGAKPNKVTEEKEIKSYREKAKN